MFGILSMKCHHINLNTNFRAKKMINKEKIYTLYMQWVDKVTEDNDWKTQFTPREIVNKICEIIEDESKNNK